MTRSTTIALLATGLLHCCHESSSTITGGDGSADAGRDTAADVPGEDPSTGCVGACARTYFEDVSACTSGRGECLLGCGGFGDWECEGACVDLMYECTMDPEREIETCMARCPCWIAFMGCAEDCRSTSDECWAGCEEEYGACSGEDIRGMGACMDGCEAASVGCGDACDEEYHSWEWVAWVECSTSCELDLYACMAGCF